MQIDVTVDDIKNILKENEYEIVAEDGVEKYSHPFTNGKFYYDFYSDYFVHRIEYKEKELAEYKLSNTSIKLTTGINQIQAQSYDEPWYVVSNVTDDYVEINAVIYSL